MPHKSFIYFLRLSPATTTKTQPIGCIGGIKSTSPVLGLVIALLFCHCYNGTIPKRYNTTDKTPFILELSFIRS